MAAAAVCFAATQRPRVAVLPCRRRLQTELVGWYVGRLVDLVERFDALGGGLTESSEGVCGLQLHLAVFCVVLSGFWAWFTPCFASHHVVLQ